MTTHCEKEEIRQLILYLDEEDAYWLRAYLQNPLVEGESTKEKERRKRIFNALNQHM